MSPRNTIQRNVFLLALVIGGFMTATQANANDKVYSRVAKSTVIIESPKSLGAGTLIDVNERLVVTANHVVAKDKEVNVYFAALDEEGHTITALKHYAANRDKLAIKGTVVGRLERCDLALVQLATLPEGAVAAPMAAQSARPGQEVHIIGHSSILRGAVFNYSGNGKVRNIEDLKLSLTIINEEGKPTRTFEGKIAETSIVTREGDSGGPVVNNAGELVAVVSGTVGAPTKDKEATELQVNMSIDISEVKTMLKASGFTVSAAPQVAKGKPADEEKEPVVKKDPPTDEEKTTPAPKTPALTGGVWKFAASDAKAGKVIFQYQFAADGTYQVTKVDDKGTTLGTGRGQYEIADNKLTFKKDGKIKLQYQIKFVDENRLATKKDGGESVTWQR